MPPESPPPNITDFGKWLGYHLTKDWRMLAKAPIAFFAVFAFSLAASWLLTWQVVVPEKNEQLSTKQGIIDGKQSQIDYLSKRLDDAQNEVSTFKSALKASPSQSLQIAIYINDPNAEKVVPLNTNEPALAYSDDGTKAIFTWSIKSQSWK